MQPTRRPRGRARGPGSPGPGTVRKTLYRYRYSTATSRIDVSGGGVADWPQYGRSQEGTRYTPLGQINRDNVAYLRKAWEYHTGDFSDGPDGRPETTFQATPILVAWATAGMSLPSFRTVMRLGWAGRS